MEKKPPRPYTPESFALAARGYLERFPCSDAKFKEVLRRKFLKRHQRPEKEWIEAAVKLGRKGGFLDDARYGQAVFEGLVRQGLPRVRIQQKLMLKQLDKNLISQLLSTLSQDIETRRGAVQIYAKRKRLGPFSKKPDERDYARLRRAGFDHDVVHWLLHDHDAAA